MLGALGIENSKKYAHISVITNPEILKFIYSLTLK